MLTILQHSSKAVKCFHQKLQYEGQLIGGVKNGAVAALQCVKQERTLACPNPV